MTTDHPEGRSAGSIRTLFEVGSPGMMTDEQLLDRLRSGDDRQSAPAFAGLIGRHGPMVLAACRRALADPHLAEDAFQATFLVLARRAGSVRDGAALAAWLHRVARRVATRAKARADRRRGRERPHVAEVAVNCPDRVEMSEIREVIDEEVDRLASSQRLPFVLCYLEGLSHEEASRRLRWPIGTVKSRLARGRRKLQDRLTRRGFAPPSALAAVTGSGLLAGEAAANVCPPLAEATSRAVAAALVAGEVAAGTVPAAVSALVREEIGLMVALKLRSAALAAAAAVASLAAIGLALAHPPGQDPPAAQDAKPPGAGEGIAARLTVSGRVVDPGGRPVPGARVILREWAQLRWSELTPEQRKAAGRGGEIADTLAETTADADGTFRFREVAAPAFAQAGGAGKTVFPWDVVALAPGLGLAWETLTAAEPTGPVVLKLADEGTIRGRVLEPGGRPVAGARVKVNGLDRLGRPDVNGVATGDRLNLNWSAFPLGSRTDAEGRFAIAGLPRDRVATLVVSEPTHEMISAYAATSDEPQADAIGRTFVSDKAIETRRPVHTGDFTLVARTADHALIGRVVFDADGKPAAAAQIVGGPEGLMADADGRFRIENLPAGPHELHAMAFGSEAAPFDGEVIVPEFPREFEREIRLPRGLVLKGRVADGPAGRGLGGIRVDYTAKYQGDQVPTRFGFTGRTDVDGRFRLVVPPGRGTLRLGEIPKDFRQPERRLLGQAADPRFSRDVEGRPGQAVELAEIPLDRGGVVTLRVVDPEGRPVPGAQVDVRDMKRGFDPKPGRADAEGRFAVTGLDPDKEAVVDVLAEARKLGATVEVGDQGPAVVEARLLPLVSVAGRVLDEDGRPLVGARVILFRDVQEAGQTGRSFGLQAATMDRVDGDGSYAFASLIPGATYNAQVEARGHATASGPHVKIRPGQPVRLDDFRLPALDQEVKGVVVDTKGRPAPGITVGYERTERTQSMDAPQEAAWFQDTDELGRFRLTGLPRGPVRLQAYRRPDATDRTIKDMRHVDVRPGQGDVRIELRDRDDRLRGIE